MKCEGCGHEVSIVGYWLGPMYSHEKNDRTCTLNKLHDARQRIITLDNAITVAICDLPDNHPVALNLWEAQCSTN